jgi:hypothetical protein
MIRTGLYGNHPTVHVATITATVRAEDLAKVYATYDRWAARADSARDRIRRAEKTLKSCDDHLGVDAVATQVAALVARYFPNHKLDVLGPFGLGSEVAIHAIDHTGLAVAGVNFRPKTGNRLHIIDWSRNTGKFPANSMGAINQLNYDTYPEPATVHDIVVNLDAQIAAHEREETQE